MPQRSARWKSAQDALSEQRVGKLEQPPDCPFVELVEWLWPCPWERALCEWPRERASAAVEPSITASSKKTGNTRMVARSTRSDRMEKE